MGLQRVYRDNDDFVGFRVLGLQRGYRDKRSEMGFSWAWGLRLSAWGLGFWGSQFERWAVGLSP